MTGYNLRTLVVGIKVLHHIERSQCIIGEKSSMGKQKKDRGIWERGKEAPGC